MQPVTRDRISINQITTKIQWSLADAIENYAAAGIKGIAIWRDKLAECGLPRAQQLIRDTGLSVTGLNRVGPFDLSTRISMAALDDAKRAIEECAALNCRCLLVLPGGLPKGSRDLASSRSFLRDHLLVIREYAHAANVTLALEPLHPVLAADRSVLNLMSQANALVAEIGADVGIVVDVYHVWWDPALEQEIHRASGRIIGFHVSDWLVPNADPLFGRGMMGDGVIDIPKIRGWAESSGYTGHIEVEIFSANDWWRRDPHEVVRVSIERCRSAV